MLEGPCGIILSCAISGTVGGKATTQISWHGKFCILPELYSLVIDLIHLQDKSAPKLSDEQVVECPFLGNLEIERPVDTSCVHIVNEWICFTSPPIVFLTRLRCISLHEDLWDCDRKQVYRLLRNKETWWPMLDWSMFVNATVSRKHCWLPMIPS